MADLDLQYSIAVQNIDGKSVWFIDNSPNYGIDGAIDYSQVRCIRLYFVSYTAEQNPTTLSGSGEMDEFREYQSLTTLPFTYDDIIVPLAGRFIPQIAGITVQANSIMQTTGRFNPYVSSIRYLPTANKIPLVLLPADFGLTETVFPDGVWALQYEVYQQTTPNPIVNAVDGVQYMVRTGKANYNGSDYETGDVFIATDNSAITPTRSGEVDVLAALVFKFFMFTYGIDKDLAALTVFALNNPNVEKEIMYEIVFIRAILTGLKENDVQNWTSANLANNTIVDIQRRISVLQNTYVILP